MIVHARAETVDDDVLMKRLALSGVVGRAELRIKLGEVVHDEEGERDRVADELHRRHRLLEKEDAAEDDEGVARDGEQLEHHDVGPLDDEEADDIDEEAQQHVHHEKVPRIRQLRHKAMAREVRDLGDGRDGPPPSQAPDLAGRGPSASCRQA